MFNLKMKWFIVTLLGAIVLFTLFFVALGLAEGAPPAHGSGSAGNGSGKIEFWFNEAVTQTASFNFEGKTLNINVESWANPMIIPAPGRGGQYQINIVDGGPGPSGDQVEVEFISWIPGANKHWGGQVNTGVVQIP